MNETDFNNLPNKVDQIYTELMNLKLIIEKKNKSPTERTQHLSITEVVRCLETEGYKISQSSIYKLTAKQKVPHSKFLGKLIFNKTDIITWAETQLNSKGNGKKSR